MTTFPIFHYTVKKVSVFIVPCRDVTDQTLPGREKFNYSQLRESLVSDFPVGVGKKENLVFSVWYCVYLFLFQWMAFYFFCHRVMCKYRQVWGNVSCFFDQLILFIENNFLCENFLCFFNFLCVIRTDFILEFTIIRRSFPISSSCRSAKSPLGCRAKIRTMQISLDWNQDISQKYKIGYVSKGVANKL